MALLKLQGSLPTILGAFSPQMTGASCAGKFFIVIC